MWGNHPQILREVQPAKGVYIHTQMHTVQCLLEGIEMAHPLGVVRKGYLEEAALVPGLKEWIFDTWRCQGRTFWEGFPQISPQENNMTTQKLFLKGKARRFYKLLIRF